MRVAMIDGAVSLEQLACFMVDQAGTGNGTRHGTAVASVILGAVGSPCADAEKIHLGSFPVLDSTGAGATADEVADALLLAIEWGADFVNISIDLRAGSDRLEDVLRRAAENGIVVVAAAGNRMGMAAGYPAAYGSVVSVGAADTDGSPLWSSAREGVDIYALGAGVDVLGEDGTRHIESGTSYASAAHVRELALSAW